MKTRLYSSEEQGLCAELAEQARAGDVRCSFKEVLANEIRYWGLDIDTSELTRKFHSQAVLDYEEETGGKPVGAFLMLNVVTSGGMGSGGGWHLDSLRTQFKSFLYLTDVDESCGPFQFYDQSGIAAKVIFWLNRLATGGNRLSDNTVGRLNPKRLESVFGSRGTYFFSKTNMAHRGCPVDSGQRIVMTCYMYEKVPRKYRDYIAGQ